MSFFPLLLLHSGGLWDELLIVGVLGYLLIMLVLAQFKKQRLRREKLRRRAEAQPSPDHDPEV